MEGFYKPSHPVRHDQIVNAVIHTAKGRFGRDAIPQHAHFAEFVEIVFAKLYDFGTSDATRCTTENHQHNDDIEFVTDIPFV